MRPETVDALRKGGIDVVPLFVSGLRCGGHGDAYDTDTGTVVVPLFVSGLRCGTINAARLLRLLETSSRSS